MVRIREIIWTLAAIIIIWQFGFRWLFYLFYILGVPVSFFIVILVLLLFIASLVAVFKGGMRTW